jgi:hypothetical protein
MPPRFRNRLVREYEIEVRPRCPKGEPLGKLALAVLVQRRYRARTKRDKTPAATRLGLGKVRLLAAQLLQCGADLKRAGIKIHVTPWERRATLRRYCATPYHIVSRPTSRHVPADHVE